MHIHGLTDDTHKGQIHVSAHNTISYVTTHTTMSLLPIGSSKHKSFSTSCSHILRQLKTWMIRDNVSAMTQAEQREKYK